MTSPLPSIVCANAVNYDANILVSVVYLRNRLTRNAKLSAGVSIWVVEAKIVRVMLFEIANVYSEIRDSIFFFCNSYCITNKPHFLLRHFFIKIVMSTVGSLQYTTV